METAVTPRNYRGGAKLAGDGDEWVWMFTNLAGLEDCDIYHFPFVVYKLN